MDYYLSNLNLLQEREPDLYKRLARITPRELPPSEPFDPSRLLPPGLDLSTIDIVVSLGFAPGEELILLERILPSRIFFLIIEYDLGHFKAALSKRDFTPLFNSKRVSLAIGEEPFAATRVRLDNYYHIVTFASLYIIEYKPSVSLSPSYYQKIRDLLKEAANVSQRNIATLTDSAPLWQHNILTNLPIIVNSPGVNTLFGRFKNIPAIIVAAGPSLDKNVTLLKEAKGKALIIAVDTALKTLSFNKIEPDIIVSIDANPMNFRDFEGVNVGEASLVAEPVTYPEILSNFPGRIFISSYGHPLMNWLEESIGPKGYLKVGGSVATTCFDLARKMECNPIIFVGQDLAYTGGMSHTKGFFEDGDILDSINKFTTLEMIHRESIQARGIELVEGMDGKMLQTSAMMKGWLNWLESQVCEVRATGTKCINATEGGAKISGTEVLSLKETIDTYCQKEFDILQRLNLAYTLYHPEPLGRLIDELDGLLREYRRIREELSEGERLSRRLLWLLQDKGSSDKITRIYERIQNLYQAVTSRPRFMRVSRWNMEPLFFRMKKAKKDNHLQTIAKIYHTFFEGAMEIVVEGIKEFSTCLQILKQEDTVRFSVVGG